MKHFDQEQTAYILVKAAPQVGQRHGETVCCAGIDDHGNWLRLYPITFRRLEAAQKFKRWDKIKFRAHRPESGDSRPESRRVDHQSIEIIGKLLASERSSFLNRIVVGSTAFAAEQGQTLALIRPIHPFFRIVRKSPDQMQYERHQHQNIAAQTDLFASPQSLVPYEPCPYEFIYRYNSESGQHEGRCQDWETDATFFNLRASYGEEAALNRMRTVFGEEYPAKGMVFAMGTHSRYPDTWLINGVIRLDETDQPALI